MWRKTSKIYFFCSVFAFLFLYNSISNAESGVILDELLTEVQKTLIRVRDTIEEEELPPLYKVVLKLKSALVTKADGRVSLYIVQLGATVAREAIQEINLELKPPKPTDTTPVLSIKDTLATAIIEAAKGAMKASKRKPPLHLSKLSAKIRFVVKQEVSGGGIFRLLPVTIRLGGQVRDVTSQEIMVEFKS